MAEAEETAQAPAKPKGRLIIWVFVAVAFLIIIGVFARLILFSPSNNPMKATQGQGLAEDEIGEQISLGDFLVNLARPDQDLLLSVNIAVELDARRESKIATDLKGEIDNRELELKETIESVLSARSRDEIDSEIGKEGMKKEMIRKLNNLLKKGKVRKVILTDMIIQ
jgi:flagellar protein FliL